MPRQSGKKRARRSEKRGEPDLTALDPRWTGMPAMDSITGVKKARVGGKDYLILDTKETDADDNSKAPGKKRSRKQ